MKITYTKHVLEDKLPLMKALGWDISRSKISQTIKKPMWTGITRFGQPTAMSLIDEKHILRVVFEEKNGIIRVITVHIARRGTYESTKN